MNLKQLAHDKALHAIGGLLVFAAVAGVLLLARQSSMATWSGAMIAVVVAGVFVEVRQHRKNKKEIAAGGQPIHDVSGKDAVATIVGGLIASAPTALSWLLGR
jgi:hypothetical protein